MPKAFKVALINQDFIVLKCAKKEVKKFFFFLFKHILTKFVLLIDISVIDFLEKKKKYFIFYHLLSLVNNKRIFLCLSSFVGEGLESISSLFLSSN